MEEDGTFGWLHISDFHSGMKHVKGRWAQVKPKFYEDIKRHHEKNGPVDLVIFSGDLTQAGEESEFTEVSNEISELWEHFSNLGHIPSLFVIPGNHDLSRPKLSSPISLAIKNWANEPALEEAVFDDPDSAYFKDIEKCFKNYTAFINDLKSRGIPLLADKLGVLPGESAAVWESRGIRVGLIGLNTAWSHLTSGDLMGKLHLSPRQIDKIESNIDAWTSNNDVNLLVTHHPVNWLTQDSQKEFRDNINPLGRFTAHLCGHMHESTALTENWGDADSKRVIQATSLFGLETFGNAAERRHGYNFAKVSLNDAHITWWPKKAENRSGAGGWMIRPDSASLPEHVHECMQIPITTKFREGKKKT